MGVMVGQRAPGDSVKEAFEAERFGGLLLLRPQVGDIFINFASCIL